MRKHILLAGIATAAAMVPGVAMAQLSGSASGSITYTNVIDTELVTSATYTKDVSLSGDVELRGTIDVQSSAVAIVDNKQLLTGNEVEFREETYVADEDDPTELGNGSIEGIFSGDEELTDIGFFANVLNDTSDIDVDGNEGNVGVNLVAGYFNQQENVAAIASSVFDDGDTENRRSAGWAEASLTAAQGQVDLYYGPDDFVVTDEENPEGTSNDYRDRNVAGSITAENGEGNIGLNLAAGAFNQQKNALVVAVVTNGALAEANAGVIQASVGSNVVSQNSRNLNEDILVEANAGNIGINSAAGVGNQQLNALVIAATQAGGDTGGGDPGGGGGEGEGG